MTTTCCMNQPTVWRGGSAPAPAPAPWLRVIRSRRSTRTMRTMMTPTANRTKHAKVTINATHQGGVGGGSRRGNIRNRSIHQSHKSHNSVHLSHTSQCTSLEQKHTCCTFMFQCGILWDVEQVHYGICEIGLFPQHRTALLCYIIVVSIAHGPELKKKSVSKPVLVDTDFLTWHLIGWWLCSQTTRSHVWNFYSLT